MPLGSHVVKSSQHFFTGEGDCATVPIPDDSSQEGIPELLEQDTEQFDADIASTSDTASQPFDGVDTTELMQGIILIVDRGLQDLGSGTASRRLRPKIRKAQS